MKNAQHKAVDFLKSHSNAITLAVTLMALLIFFIRGLYFTEYQIDNMDEGTYLLKGKYFLQGTYQPYETGGPITNKGIFSFWILGLTQLVAPGLWSGRLFALLLSIAMLAGLWVIIRRLSNQIWATAILLLFSLNTFWITMYTRALTQVVCAVLITFTILLFSQKKVRVWQLCLAMIFAAITSLTRQNLLPFFVFSILFVFWQFGYKKAWLPVLAGVAFFVVINLIYWPDMYNMMWRPHINLITSLLRGIVPGLSTPVSVAAQTDLGTLAYIKEFTLNQELYVIFNTVAVYSVPILFSIFFLINANWSKAGKSPRFKLFIFLWISFLVLMLIHLLAVLLDNTILYSLPIYPGFFLPLGLIIIPCCYEWMSVKGNAAKAFILIALALATWTGIGLYMHRTFSDLVMFIQVPRMRSMKILPGTTELWRFLENKYEWGFKNLEFITAAGYGFFVGLLFVIMLILIWRLAKRKGKQIAFSRLFTLGFLGIMVFLSPSKYLAGQTSIEVCEESVIDRLEKVAGDLSAIIPPGSLIYWEYHSPVLLLNMGDIRLFPAQLNSVFYKREGGEEEALLDKNMWNDEIAEKWLQEADFVLLNETGAQKWEPLINEKYPTLFDKIGVTENLTPCIDRSYLHVYQTIKP